MTLPSDVSESFFHYLRHALAHFHELPIQRTHPLCGLLSGSAHISPADLQSMIAEAIEQLKPQQGTSIDSPRGRRYRYLVLRYLEGVPLDQVAQILGIGERQARREHRIALHELAGILVRGQREFSTAIPASNPFTRHDGLSAIPYGRMFRDDTVVETTTDFTLEHEIGVLEIEPNLDSIALADAIDDASLLVSRLAAHRGVEVHFQRPRVSSRVIVARTVLRQILLTILNEFINSDSINRIDITIEGSEEFSEIRIMGRPSKVGVGPSGTKDAINSVSWQTARRLAEGQDGILRVNQLASGDTVARLLFVPEEATRVLVVDDNPDLARLFRRYLRGGGFRVLQACDSVSAVQMAATLQPDVVTLDLMMPTHDGWDILRTLQGNPTTSAIPIVACSVLPKRELALSLGVSEFLAKPVTLESLTAVLAPYRRQRLQAR